MTGLDIICTHNVTYHVYIITSINIDVLTIESTNPKTELPLRMFPPKSVHHYSALIYEGRRWSTAFIELKG